MVSFSRERCLTDSKAVSESTIKHSNLHHQLHPASSTSLMQATCKVMSDDEFFVQVTILVMMLQLQGSPLQWVAVQLDNPQVCNVTTTYPQSFYTNFPHFTASDPMLLSFLSNSVLSSGASVHSFSTIPTSNQQSTTWSCVTIGCKPTSLSAIWHHNLQMSANALQGISPILAPHSAPALQNWTSWPNQECYSSYPTSTGY